ncbi:MAG: sulfurtransferase-like selenium metabolism protein YedF [Eubacteriales bacterium]
MITVDAMGQACPMPVILTKKAMANVENNAQLEVLVDNEIAMQNVSKMAASQGGQVEVETISDKEYKVLITVGEGEETMQEEVATITVEDNMVMVFSSDLMGSGNDALGKVLMKGYIFAVTQLEKLPKTMLFYNGGATLTAEGSDSIEDLKHLAEEGVEILTCGTCLNYYELSDKLLVGDVTNMYTIVEKMTGASKIVRP